MSFSTQLSAHCEEYVHLSYGGYSFVLPYYLGGKNTPAQIIKAISNWAGTAQKTKDEIQRDITNNPASTGVDCSGLVYYALNEASNGAVRTYFENKLNLPGLLSYAYGISAENLTNAAYGTKITAAKNVKSGCVIRFDNGGHILVVDDILRDSKGNIKSIWYTHSNGSKGPHWGNITIGDASKDLNDAAQTWNDSAYTDATAKSYYNYTLQLDCISKLV